MHINCFSLLLFSFLTISCTGQDQAQVTLNKIRSYTLPLPDSIAPNSWTQKVCVSCSEEGEDWLYYLSDDEDLIIVYNLMNRSIVKVIPLLQQGPNNVGSVAGFSVLNRDSIFLSAIGTANNEIINDKGEIIGKIRYSWEEEQLPDFTALASRFYTDLDFSGDLIFAPQGVPIYGYKPPTTDHRPIVEHNLRTGVSRLLNFKFPKEYYESNMPLVMSFSSDKESIYFSLMKDHHVFQIDKMTEEVNSMVVKSRFAPKEFKSMNGIGGMVEIKTYAAGSVGYSAVFADPYRNYIYRIVTMPPRHKERLNEALSQVYNVPDRLSIIVCDKNLNVLYEQELDERTYYPYGIFITKEGINIPKTHPDYFLERGKEDEMVYDVFLPE
jgi:hypothetical protein